MIGEESVSIDKVKITLIRVRESLRQMSRFFGCVQAEELVEPFLDRVVVSISDWFV